MSYKDISGNERSPWDIDWSASTFWQIINKLTGKTKYIGPATGHGTNYYDKAIIEAERRNDCIRNGQTIVPLATRITRKLHYLELLAKFIELRQNGTAGGRVAAFLTECSQNNIDLSPWEKRINALKLKVCST